MVIYDVLILLVLGAVLYLLLARRAAKIGCFVLRFLGYKVDDHDKEEGHSGF